MKKKLIEAIKAKFVGIDDNTAGRLAERLLRKGDPITTDDEVVAAVETISLSDVLKSVSDFSADDATRKYEAKYGLKNGVPEKKEAGEDPNPNPGEQKPGTPKQEDQLAGMKELMSSMLKDLTGKIEGLGNELAVIKSGRIAESRKAKVDSVIKNLRESQKKAYSRIPLDKMTEDEFDSFLSEISEEVNDIVAENKASGSSFNPPIGGVHHTDDGGTKEATKDEIDTLVGKFNIK